MRNVEKHLPNSNWWCPTFSFFWGVGRVGWCYLFIDILFFLSLLHYVVLCFLFFSFSFASVFFSSILSCNSCVLPFFLFCCCFFLCFVAVSCFFFYWCRHLSFPSAFISLSSQWVACIIFPSGPAVYSLFLFRIWLSLFSFLRQVFFFSSFYFFLHILSFYISSSPVFPLFSFFFSLFTSFFSCCFFFLSFHSVFPLFFYFGSFFCFLLCISLIKVRTNHAMLVWTGQDPKQTVADRKRLWKLGRLC